MTPDCKRCSVAHSLRRRAATAAKHATSSPYKYPPYPYPRGFAAGGASKNSGGMSALERGPRSGDDADAAALLPLVLLLLRGAITGAAPREGDGQSPTLS